MGVVMTSTQAAGAASTIYMIVMLVIMFALMYFLMIHVTEFPERFSDLFFCQCNLHATFLLF